MKCGRCQFDVSVGFAFCPGCGLKLAAVAPAPAAEPGADRRSATVLFADLSGFTAISERLDPEDVRRLQTDLFGALRRTMALTGYRTVKELQKAELVVTVG